jgi:hypothetical protein
MSAKKTEGAHHARHSIPFLLVFLFITVTHILVPLHERLGERSRQIGTAASG